MKHKILFSGFKPFAGQGINPSGEILFQLKKEGHPIVLLDVEYHKSFEQLKQAVEEFKPDAIIMLGQARGRNKVSLERVALNWQESSIADEAGVLSKGNFIEKDGEGAFFNRWPLDTWIQDLSQKGFRLERSFSAGAFVCNCLYYKINSWLAKSQSNLKNRNLFIHIPLIPEQIEIECLNEKLELNFPQKKSASELITSIETTPTMSLNETLSIIHAVMDKIRLVLDLEESTTEKIK